MKKVAIGVMVGAMLAGCGEAEDPIEKRTGAYTGRIHDTGTWVNQGCVFGDANTAPTPHAGAAPDGDTCSYSGDKTYLWTSFIQQVPSNWTASQNVDTAAHTEFGRGAGASVPTVSFAPGAHYSPFDTNRSDRDRITVTTLGNAAGINCQRMRVDYLNNIHGADIMQYFPAHALTDFDANPVSYTNTVGRIIPQPADTGGGTCSDASIHSGAPYWTLTNQIGYVWYKWRTSEGYPNVVTMDNPLEVWVRFDLNFGTITNRYFFHGKRAEYHPGYQCTSSFPGTNPVPYTNCATGMTYCSPPAPQYGAPLSPYNDFHMNDPVPLSNPQIILGYGAPQTPLDHPWSVVSFGGVNWSADTRDPNANWGTLSIRPQQCGVYPNAPAGPNCNPAMDGLSMRCDDVPLRYDLWTDPLSYPDYDVAKRDYMAFRGVQGYMTSTAQTICTWYQYISSGQWNARSRIVAAGKIKVFQDNEDDSCWWPTNNINNGSPNSGHKHFSVKIEDDDFPYAYTVLESFWHYGQ